MRGSSIEDVGKKYSEYFSGGAFPWYENKQESHRRPRRPVGNHSNVNLEECAKRCLISRACLSFFYKDTGELCDLFHRMCILHNNETKYSNGFRYFQPGKCGKIAVFVCFVLLCVFVCVLFFCFCFCFCFVFLFDPSEYHMGLCNGSFSSDMAKTLTLDITPKVLNQIFHTPKAPLTCTILDCFH